MPLAVPLTPRQRRLYASAHVNYSKSSVSVASSVITGAWVACIPMAMRGALPPLLMTDAVSAGTVGMVALPAGCTKSGAQPANRRVTEGEPTPTFHSKPRLMRASHAGQLGRGAPVVAKDTQAACIVSASTSSCALKGTESRLPKRKGISALCIAPMCVPSVQNSDVGSVRQLNQLGAWLNAYAYSDERQLDRSTGGRGRRHAAFTNTLRSAVEASRKGLMVC